MKVKELLTDESKWCKGRWGITVEGINCEAISPRAVKWCLVGAMQRCYPIHAEYLDTYRKVQNHLGLAHGTSLSFDFNDISSTDFKTIKQLVDELDI